MSAEQLTQLERQYTQKRLFEYFEVPRLSLILFDVGKKVVASDS